MKHPLFALSLGLVLIQAHAGFSAEPRTKSPRAGTDAGKQKFDTPFVPEDAWLVSIEVNTGVEYGTTVVKGFRFIGETAEGKRVTRVAGPADGSYQAAIELKRGVEVVGITGKHGALIDSIRFHFSDGTSSPILGGSGGGEEFWLLIQKKDGKYRGHVRGLFGLAEREGITSVGLLLLGQGGQAAELDQLGGLELTIQGEVGAELAPSAGRLTELYYECFPALLRRFDNPHKRANRHITITFKHEMKVPASCAGSEISVSIDWLKHHPTDVALLTHELTHAAQHYPPGAPGWLVVGIADYARHVYGPKHQGGWKLPDAFKPNENYNDGYRTTARFLLWLEERSPGIVNKLHRRLQSGQFTLGEFKQITGKTVDQLWAECVENLGSR